MTTVLLTDGGTRNALAYTRSLGRRDIDVVVGAEDRLAATLYSNHATETFKYPDIADSPRQFFDEIGAAVSEYDVDVVIPLTEPTADIVLPRREELRGAEIPYPDYETFSLCRNKSDAIRLASEQGIGVPETRRPETLDEARAAANDIGYPVILKPRIGHGSRGTTMIDDEEELANEFGELQSRHGEYLVQEFVPGHRSIVDVPMVLDDGDHVASMVSNRIRQFPENGPNCFGKAIVDEELREGAVALMESIGWHGACLVEFKIDERDGRAKLMEINPRSWGSTYLGVVSGMDFPHLLYRVAVGDDVEPTTEYRTDRKARHLLPADLLAPFMSDDRADDLRRWILDFFDPTVRYYFPDRGDPLPAVAQCLDVVSAALTPRHLKDTLFRGI